LAEMCPDGHLYSSDPSNALPGILHALGDTRVPDRQEERSARLQVLLADRRALVLLENAKSAAQIRHVLPVGGECALIVTGRSPLTSLRNAIQIALGGFPADDAWACSPTVWASIA
jgi:hypothetical protein